MKNLIHTFSDDSLVTPYMMKRVDKKTKIVINTIDKLGGDWPASVLE